MAFLAAIASGLLSAAATWRVCHATNSRLNYNAEDGWSLANDASNVDANMTFDGSTVWDGIGLRLSRPASITGGTFTVKIWNITDSVIVATGTLDVMSISVNGTSTDNPAPWSMIEFPAFTPAAGKSYNFAISVQGLVGTGSVSAMRTSTANQWLKLIRTGATAAPASGDLLFVQGTWNTGVLTTYVVTVDSTSAALDLGPAGTPSINMPAIAIGLGGKLNFPRTQNTLLRCSGDVHVMNGGVLDMGTRADPIPRAYDAVLEIEQTASDGQFGLRIKPGCTVTMVGQSRTAGKDIDRCLLTADVAASGVAPSSSTLPVSEDTGWRSGDAIALGMPSNSRTVTTVEQAVLSADAGANSLVASYFNALTGTGITVYPKTDARGMINARQASTLVTPSRIILLTRNVKFRSAGSVNSTFFYAVSSSSFPVFVDLFWAEFYLIGSNTTAKRGLDIQSSSGSTYTIERCSFHNFKAYLTYLNNVHFGIKFNDNVACHIGGLASTTSIWINSGSVGGFVEMLRNWVFRGFNGGAQISEYSFNFSGNVFSGCGGNVIQLQSLGRIGKFEDNEVQGGATSAVNLTGAVSGTAKNFKAWNVNSSPVLYTLVDDFVFDNPTFFGNNGGDFGATGAPNGGLYSKGGKFNATTAFTGGNSIQNGVTGGSQTIFIEDADMSVVDGDRIAHSIDISLSGNRSLTEIYMTNCILAAATEVSIGRLVHPGTFVASMNHDRVAGNHKRWTRGGRIEVDQTIFRTVAPSIRMTPVSTAQTVYNTVFESGSDIMYPTENYLTYFDVGDYVSISYVPADTYVTEYLGHINAFRLNKAATSSGSGSSVTPGHLLEGFTKNIPVAAGQSKTIRVWVRRSLAGDGSAYSGSNPRMIQKANSHLGLAADVVLAIGSAANGVWEELVGTTSVAASDGVIEVFIAIAVGGGTVGFVTVDDWSAD